MRCYFFMDAINSAQDVVKTCIFGKKKKSNLVLFHGNYAVTHEC